MTGERLHFVAGYFQPSLLGFPAQPVLGPCFSTGLHRPTNTSCPSPPAAAKRQQAGTGRRTGESSTSPDVNVGSSSGYAAKGP